MAAVLQRCASAIRALLDASECHAALRPTLAACPPQLGVSEWREERQYDVVTCMFAIHYFFVTEAALKQVRHSFQLLTKAWS